MSIAELFPASFAHTFFDSLTMYADDVENLAPGRWLNDSCIGFYYLYLENAVHAQHRDRLLFVSPSTVYWVQMAPSADDIRDAVEPLGISQKELVFLPINDNADHEQAGGGNHWSLVVYRRCDDTYYVYDSSSGSNFAQARRTIAKVDRFVCAGSPTRSPRVVERPTPQQQNSFDCGVFVLAITEHIARHAGDDAGLSDNVTQSAVAKLRKHIIFTIHSQWQQDVQQMQMQQHQQQG